jgi:hypothetical protein
LVRVRQARHDLIAGYFNDPAFRPSATGQRMDAIVKICRVYLRRFGPEAILPAEVAQQADAVLNWKPQGAEKLAYILRDLSKTCVAMDRYERRALSRRKFAIRALDVARRQAVEENEKANLTRQKATRTKNGLGHGIVGDGAS